MEICVDSRVVTRQQINMPLVKDWNVYKSLDLHVHYHIFCVADARQSMDQYNVMAAHLN